MRRLPRVAAIAIIVVLATLIVVPVCLLLRDGRRDGNPHSPTDVETANDARERHRVRTPEPAGSSLDEAPMGDCAIVVHVTLDGAPAAATIELRRVPVRDGTWARMVGALDAPLCTAPPDKRVRTDGAGTARIAELPVGDWHVLAATDDGVRGAHIASFGIAGESSEVTVALRTGTHALHGRLTGTDGAPFTGEVALSPDGEEVTRTVRATDGLFRFESVAAGRYRILVAVPGRLAWRSAWLVVPFEGQLELSLAPEETVHGRVVARADGTPISGAAVVVTAIHSYEREQITTMCATAADGAFEAPAAKITWITVSAPGWAPARVHIRGGTRDGETLDVALARPARVSGRVVRATDGAPVGGVRVHVRSADRPPPILPAQRFESGNDGSFVIDGLAPGEYDVFALGGGWASEDLPVADRDGYAPFRVVVDEVAVDELVLRVVPSGGLTCRVTDADGSPVRGAVVSGRPARTFLPRPDGATALTDEDGIARLRDLVVGMQHYAQVRANDGRCAAEAGMPGGDGSDAAIEIQLGALRSVVVRAVEVESGGPVAGARIRVRGAVGAGMWGYPDATTGADGTATVRPAPDGVARIDVTARGWTTTEWVEAPSNLAERWVVDVRVPRGRTITGRMLRPDGTPAAGIEVEARNALSSDDAEPVARALTYLDGTFVLQGLAMETVTVSAHGVLDGVPLSGSCDVTSHVSGFELVLSGPGPPEISCVVHIAGPDGEPVHSARCELTTSYDGTTSYRTHTLERGRVSLWIDTHPGARNTLWIGAPRDPQGRALPFASATVVIPPSTRGPLEVRLEPERVIEGRVTNADGDPIAGARVRAYEYEERLGADEPERYGSRVFGESVSDRDDVYRIGWLPAGDHVLIVTVPPGWAIPAPARVTAGARHDVVLTTGVRAVIRVLDASGEPVEHARVQVVGPRMSASLETDAWGDAIAMRLSPGSSYEVGITPPESSGLLEKTIPSWMPEDTTITLERSFSIRGIVVDEDGRPVPTGTVWQQKSGRPRVGDVLDSVGRDGSFEFDGLPAGAVLTLRAEVGEVRGPAQEVAAGSHDARLVVTLGPRIEVRVKDTMAQRITVVAIGPDGQRRTETTYSGIVTFAGLDARARYTLLVGPTKSGRFAVRRDVAPNVEPLEIELLRGERITGRVEGLPEGADALVVGEGPDGFRAETETSPDGSFRLDGLAPGTWTLRVEAEVDGATLRSESRTDAGAKDEVLILR